MNKFIVISLMCVAPIIGFTADQCPRMKISETAPAAAYCTGKLARLIAIKVQSKQSEEIKYLSGLIIPLSDFAKKKSS